MKNKLEFIENVYLTPIDIENQKDFDSLLEDYYKAKSKSSFWRRSGLWFTLAIALIGMSTWVVYKNHLKGEVDQVQTPNDTLQAELELNEFSLPITDSVSTDSVVNHVLIFAEVDSQHSEKQDPGTKKALGKPKIQDERQLSKEGISPLPELDLPPVELPALPDLPVPEKPVKTATIKIEEAHPIDGFDHLYAWFEENITYPEQHKKEKIEGYVKVSFLLGKDSTVSVIKVSQSLGPAFDQEAVRLIERMPKWIPAKRNGIPFSKRFVLPIGFKVESR
ncbi:TonB family C-terminal domain-containing protein [Algoriphagus locisalis]|uniref:TonB family C-terminal domain-containing protein n=1 Tax=Algoriphagus locisalis TaxID=305507 RepID=A0A1I6Y872_9BACT|nr:energy transducer TonB [Algoriphagus locisalis]SFT46587.1 TonB family C-terminal domain-containing protein [Algoriphagus locisalis]